MVEPLLHLEEEILSAAICAIRQHRGLSNHQAASRMKLATPAYDLFERYPADYRHLRAFAEAVDCDLFALLLSAQIGSAELAVRCADNKAAIIAVGLVEDLLAECGGERLEAFKPAELMRAVDKARRDLTRCAQAPQGTAAPSPRLTRRQVECLSWAQDGKSSSDIGVILGLSARTIDGHVRDACSRLGVRTRIQAISRAVALGYLAPLAAGTTI